MNPRDRRQNREEAWKTDSFLCVCLSYILKRWTVNTGTEAEVKFVQFVQKKDILVFTFSALEKWGLELKWSKYTSFYYSCFFLVVLFQKKKEKKKRFESTEVGMSHLVHKMDSITVLPHSLKIQLSGLTNMQEIWKIPQKHKELNCFWYYCKYTAQGFFESRVCKRGNSWGI